jgi:hypothetical protein
VHNNIFENISLANAGKNAIKVYHSDTFNNTFRNVSIVNSTLAAINITDAKDTDLINITFTDTPWDLYINSPTNDAVSEYWLEDFSLKYENTNGIIKFINTSMTATGLNLSQVIQITTNSIFVNTTLAPEFNQSANITIYGLGLTDTKAQVAIDDTTFTDCTPLTTPACYELFDDGDTLVFNVSHFTTYRGASNATQCQNITVADTTISLIEDVTAVGTCFNIKADDVVIDCDGNTITGTQNGYGINASGYTGLIVRECTITNFTRAISLNNVNDSVFDNNTLIRNNGDYAGIYAYQSNYNNITNSIFTYNNASDNAGLFLEQSIGFRVINTTYASNNVTKNSDINGGGIVGLYDNSNSIYFENIQAAGNIVCED